MAAIAPGLQRVRYVDGERLRACDLNVDAAHESWMLARHVRALHDTWGVALGYAVSVAPSGNALWLNPGLAYDCLGRSIVSPQPILVPLPVVTAGPEWFDLVIQLAGPIDRLPHCTPPGTNGASPRVERPEIRLLAAGAPVGASGEPPPLAAAIRLGHDIPLARVALPLAAGAVPVLSSRRNARRLVRPRIKSGLVTAGAAPIAGTPLEWWSTIDVPASDFGTDQPTYFATLADDPTGSTSLFASQLVPPRPCSNGGRGCWGRSSSYLIRHSAGSRFASEWPRSIRMSSRHCRPAGRARRSRRFRSQSIGSLLKQRTPDSSQVESCSSIIVPIVSLVNPDPFP